MIGLIRLFTGQLGGTAIAGDTCGWSKFKGIENTEKQRSQSVFQSVVSVPLCFKTLVARRADPGFYCENLLLLRCPSSFAWHFLLDSA
jgi:hypothetical protein